MFTIQAVNPDAPVAAQIVSDYMADAASRWYGRTATTEEVDQALRDEPYGNLQAPTAVLLAAIEDGCVGVRFVGEEAELTKVFTLPAHRGRGVASRLLRAGEQACREHAIGTLRLDTRADLTEACALYERAGFESVDAFNVESYSDRWYSKILTPSVRPVEMDSPI